VIAGAILSFAKSMGEFGATITFVSNIPGETQTLPSAIYTFTQCRAAMTAPCGSPPCRSRSRCGIAAERAAGTRIGARRVAT
jgi:hypothetical protein